MFQQSSNQAPSSNRELGLQFQRPIIIATSNRREQEPLSPRLPVGENDQLLDINGLLEIERLIRGIKEDGRLKDTDMRDEDFTGSPSNSRRNNH